MRPIVSYYNHPLKQSFNFASRGLGFLVKNADLDDFTLWKTHDLCSKIKECNTDLKNIFGGNTKIISYCADIKNMYTELPHKIILEAIQFVLDRCCKKTRRNNITLEKRKRGEIHLGENAAITTNLKQPWNT